MSTVIDRQSATAYTSLMDRIRELELGSLHGHEAELLRQAADELLFEGHLTTQTRPQIAKLFHVLPERGSFSDRSANELRGMLKAITSQT